MLVYFCGLNHIAHIFGESGGEFLVIGGGHDLGLIIEPEEPSGEELGGEGFAMTGRQVYHQEVLFRVLDEALELVAEFMEIFAIVLIELWHH